MNKNIFDDLFYFYDYFIILILVVIKKISHPSLPLFFPSSCASIFLAMTLLTNKQMTKSKNIYLCYHNQGQTNKQTKN
jgi:hypothetical protein